MRAHVLQHVSFEGLGSIGPWLQAAGYEITHTRFFDTVQLPQVAAIDLLIIMGGPMSVNDEVQYPWLAAEKIFIRAVIESGKPVLGICLGAQLIAAALGARVYASCVKEIGWFPVQGTASASAAAFRFPPSTLAFHWHGETFDLPPQAELLARSNGCENQAFQIGASVIGLQFHLETTPQSARDMVIHCKEGLLPGKCVQTAEEILSAAPEHYTSINLVMGAILSYLHTLRLNP